MTNLTLSLIQAWHNRYERATTDLSAAQSAPALFTPGFVAEAEQRAAHALRQYRRTEVTAP